MHPSAIGNYIWVVGTEEKTDIKEQRENLATALVETILKKGFKILNNSSFAANSAKFNILRKQ